MLHGRIIAESLRPGAELDVPGLTLTRVSRQDVSGSVAAGQPPVWTLIDVAAPAASAGPLAAALSTALAAEGGWYADFRDGPDHVVVFAGQIFRYAVGDTAGRQEAVDYGRSVGVPDHQLDWDG
ncbi:hypothetical protein AB0F81_29970 [Actinoplanes sp. NPDC024001]|uniref:hypothetical protein n=1 Tax=Actinoplanes sp. NPDC024001 TaxID=3154598 RepID=UPI0033CCDBCC